MLKLEYGKFSVDYVPSPDGKLLFNVKWEKTYLCHIARNRNGRFEVAYFLISSFNFRLIKNISGRKQRRKLIYAVGI